MHADVRRSVTFCALLTLAQAFYIPGFSFKTYRDGEVIPLLVNKVYSEKSELQYAYTELPFACPPTGRVRTGRFTSGASISLNLGEVLRGDRIRVSDYELVMGKDEEVRYLCTKEVDAEGLRKTQELVANGYVAEWIVDNLPGATSFQTTDKTRKYYAAGFKIGEEVLSINDRPPSYIINNHVTLVIRYHRAPGKDGAKGKMVIVGFEVFPKSVGAANRVDELPADVQDRADPMALELRSNHTGEVGLSEGATLSIPFTYSVYFREDETLEWQNRWDRYFVAQNDSSNVHWLAIVNSVVIAGLLTAVVAVILTRTIRGEIRGQSDDSVKLRSRRTPALRPSKPSDTNNGLLGQVDDVEADANISDDDDMEDMTGWKLIHGDVFRPPPHGALLAPLIGSGTQLLFTTIGLIILSAVGILNPSYRGGYVSVGFGLWIFAGFFSGYFSSRVYKTFGGQQWQKNVFVTASLVPGLLFATLFVLNLFVWTQASSTALPFTTLLALVALWLFIQLPLNYIGGWYGFARSSAWTPPIRANVIPRQIPPQPWYTKPARAVLLAGLVPFVVIFIELVFVFQSLWVNKSGYYYVFGFMGVVFGILGVSIVEVTVVGTYLLLCAENYNWHWHAFLLGSSSSLHIFIYLAYYFFTKLHIIGFVSSLLFFAYGALACALYALLAGTVGVLSAWVFVHRIYAAVKVD